MFTSRKGLISFLFAGTCGLIMWFAGCSPRRGEIPQEAKESATATTPAPAEPAGPSTEPPSVEDLLAEVERIVKQEEAGWSRSSSLCLLIWAQARAGLFEKAFQTVQLEEEARTSVSDLCEIAMVQARAGHQAAAQKTFQEASQIATHIADKEEKLGALSRVVADQVEVGDAQARQTIQRLRQMAPQIQGGMEKVVLWCSVAAAEAGLGKEAAAVAAFQEAERIARQKTMPDLSLLDVAMARATVGHVSAALRTASLLRSDLNRDMAWSSISDAQVKAGQFDEALRTAQKMGDKDFREKTLSGLAVAQARAGKLKAAAQTAARIKNPGPRNEALCALAVAQAQAKDPQAARQTLQEASASIQSLEISDDKVRAWCGLGVAQAEVGAPQAAQHTFQRALDLTLQHGDSLDQARALSAIAVAHAQAGELREAVATARQIQPDSSRAEALLEVIEVWLERPGSRPAQDRSSAD